MSFKGCNLLENPKIREIFEKSRGNEEMDIRHTSLVERHNAQNRFEDLKERQGFFDKQVEYFKKEQSKVETQIQSLSEQVPELKRKKIEDNAKELLAELAKEGRLIFKESSNFTVAVDLDYEDPKVVDRDDIGIREFKQTNDVPKSETIERLIAAHNALHRSVPSEFLTYYSIK